MLNLFGYAIINQYSFRITYSYKTKEDTPAVFRTVLHYLYVWRKNEKKGKNEEKDKNEKKGKNYKCTKRLNGYNC